MSMPTTDFKCDACNFQSSSTVIWGSSHYLDESNAEVNLEKILGWCCECQSIAPIECFDDELLIITKIIEHSQHLQPSFAHIIKWVFSGEYRNHLGSINRLNKRLSIIKLRKGKECCLNCGSQNVDTIFQGNKQASSINSSETLHPGCKSHGKLNAQPGLNINMSLSPRFYDLNGEEIDH